MGIININQIIININQIPIIFVENNFFIFSQNTKI